MKKKLVNNIPAEHAFKCNNCHEDFDMRDLSQVFYHEGDCLLHLETRLIPFETRTAISLRFGAFDWFYSRRNQFLIDEQTNVIYLN